ncbi:hypothetical protein CPB83DRAFT_858982 [Crepidotus variabilis]|uniref:Cytochrome P450 n=1 Tax=Crepidotus variabilis TaxID=179855 RepID=A0A9P6EAY0_9AGAR|nr:hypothetical protein CPB83DRAFT_858982 [Crepidotus variabilis]
MTDRNQQYYLNRAHFIIDFLMARSDTTVTAMTSLFYLLISNPGCYKRLQTDVDNAFLKGESASGTLGAATDYQKRDLETVITFIANRYGMPAY